MTAQAMIWRCRDRCLQIGGQPLIMGILNVTPDSFSDGGRFRGPAEAIDCGLRMVQDGADILDVGGESTRPGAATVPEEEEQGRVVPVIAELRRQTEVPLSVDTRKSSVAAAALKAGADIVNDVSALTYDRRMGEVAREAGAGVVLVHMQGEPATMQMHPAYGDVVKEVSAYLQERIRWATEYGIRRQNMAVDPGIGFGKTFAHNLQLLTHLPQLAAECGRPVMVGLSRKRFIGEITGREARDRLAGTLAALTYCILRGAQILRVHDVREACDAVKMVAALNQEAG